MRRAYMASHGKMAAGMVDTLRMFTAETAIEPICVYSETTRDLDEFEEMLDELIKRYPGDELIFFSDLMGGSVSNAIVKRAASAANVFSVTGANVQLLLEFALAEGAERDTEALLRRLTHSARKGLIYLNDLIEEETEVESS